MKNKRVVLIAGEDAAPEAVRPTVELIDRLELPLEWLHPVVGEEALARHGTLFPDEARRLIDASDAALFGATSGKTVPVLFYLRWGKETYANVRPTRWIPGFQSPLKNPRGIDFVIVREMLEDAYVAVEGEVEALRPAALHSPTVKRPLAELGPGRFAVKLITEAGTERVVRFSCELARRRKEEGHRGRVTCATKHNMLQKSDGLFLEVARDTARGYPDVEFESFLVDDFARRIVAVPQDLDVVVLPNLYGDILSDSAAAILGGLGLAPSGCYGDTYAYFEPTHGSAPDLVGQGVINPTATLLSAVMMLEHLGLVEGAERLRNALERVYAEGGVLTRDQGGHATTKEFCAAVARLL